jgi:uncharacterized membrane protein YadS
VRLAGSTITLLTTTSLTEGVNDLSRWCLVTAIAAIGIKTRLGEIARVGFRPVVLMIIETVLLAAMVIAVLVTDLV